MCGDPTAAKRLLAGEIAELPRYEDALQVGYWWMQWVFGPRRLWRKLAGMVHMVSQQARAQTV